MLAVHARVVDLLSVKDGQEFDYGHCVIFHEYRYVEWSFHKELITLVYHICYKNYKVLIRCLYVFFIKNL